MDPALEAKSYHTDDHGALLMGVHLAEYTALTNRMTYWITLQYATYALAAASLGFVAQSWKNIQPSTLGWSSLVVLEFLAWALLQTGFEIFTYVVYIERVLKPKIKPLVGGEGFWEFESQFLTQRRRSPFIRFEWRYGLSVPFLLAAFWALHLITTSLNETGWRLSSYFWLASTLYLALMIAGKAYHLIKLQSEAR